MIKQYVQHISGQGEKWELDGKGIIVNEIDTWAVKKKDNSKLHHYLPKSEYRLCEPPGPKWEPIDAVYIDVRVVNEDGTFKPGYYRRRASDIEKKVNE
jgi:hypothetical protein